MTVDMNQPSEAPEPTVQPVSMHGEHHSHGSLHLIVGLLGVLLMLETIAMGYMVKEYVGLKNRLDTFIATKTEVVAEKIEEVKYSSVPFLYVKNNQNLQLVNRKTGTEETVYTPEFGIISVFAVPQVKYDGRIFLATSCNDCDSPSIAIQSYDLATGGTPTKIAFNEGSFYRGSVAASPDQTKLAAANYTDVYAGSAGQLSIVNLLTGEAEGIWPLAEGEYISEYFGENTFAGAEGFTVKWDSRDCASARIYQDDPNDPESSKKVYKTTVAFGQCELGFTNQ